MSSANASAQPSAATTTIAPPIVVWFFPGGERACRVFDRAVDAYYFVLKCQFRGVNAWVESTS